MIYVYGFYHRANLGDDVFAKVFTQILPNARLINPDDEIWPGDDVRAVMVGGGDLINDYFMKRLAPIFTPDRTWPVYAVGVGIPYPKLIDAGYLDKFDYIIHRTWTEHSRLIERYGPERVHFSPDLAWLTADVGTPAITERGLISWVSNLFRPPSLGAPAGPAPRAAKVAVCLARPMFHPSHPENYERLVDTLAEFLSELADTIEIDLIPFGRGTPNQDDQIINSDVLKRMLPRLKPAHRHVRLVQPLTPDTVASHFQRYDFAICSRFHAHVFALMAQVPVMSVSCTNKTRSLMAEAGLTEYLYALPVDPVDLSPIDCQLDTLKSTWSRLVQDAEAIRGHLADFAQTRFSQVAETALMVKNLVRFLPKLPIPEQVARRVQEIRNLGDDGRAARLACYLLTGNPEAEYLWGLEQNMRLPNFNLLEACTWIHTDHRHDIFPTWKKLAPEISEVTADFEVARVGLGPKVHRSGWAYVMQNVMQEFHRAYPKGPEGAKGAEGAQGALIFDGYLDETFGWRAQLLEDAGVIPYRRPWMGVLHHTPDETFSDNNLVRLFAQPSWRESLATCRGLIVLSDYLAQWVKSHLAQFFPDGKIPTVTVMHHPTEFPAGPASLWKMSRAFPPLGSRCGDGKIVQVGGWLRDTYKIYELPRVPGMVKYALKGRGLHYWSNEEFNEFYHSLGPAITQPENVPVFIHPPVCANVPVCSPPGPIQPGPSRPDPYVRGAWASMKKLVRENHHSVTLIDFQGDAEYDELLASSVIFLYLVDASAVNTVIECIVRTTPILINHLPAVVEYLGPKYPLYYTSLEHAAELAADRNQIRRAHRYLKRLDKSRLTMDYFKGALRAPLALRRPL